MLHLPGNNLRVLAEGKAGAKLLRMDQDQEAWMAEVAPIPPLTPDMITPELTALVRTTPDYFENTLRSAGGYQVSCSVL